MEDVGTVAVHQQTCRVLFIEGVAADMRAPVDQQNTLAKTSRQPFRKDRPGKARADDEIVEP